MRTKVETANTNTEDQGIDQFKIKKHHFPIKFIWFKQLGLRKLQKKNLVEVENNHQVPLIPVIVMENLS